MAFEADEQPAQQHARLSPSFLTAIPTFEGIEGLEAHEWLEGLEDYAQMCGWSAELCLRIAKRRCTGAARTWVTGCTYHGWPDFKDQFIKRFGEDYDTVLAEFEDCRQHAKERTLTYRDRFLSLASRAGRRVDDLLIKKFFWGLRPELQAQLVPQKHALTTLDLVVRAAQDVEEYLKKNNGDFKNPAARGMAAPNSANYNGRKPWDNRRPAFERRPFDSGNAGAQLGPRNDYVRQDRGNHPNNYRPPGPNRNAPPAAAPFYRSAAQTPAPAQPAGDVGAIADLAKKLEGLSLNLVQTQRSTQGQIDRLSRAIMRSQTGGPTAAMWDILAITCTVRRGQTLTLRSGGA
jgi:hypothetical protein